MCMYYCWICCASMCCINLYNVSDKEFPKVQFYLCIWGLINYIVFTYVAELELIFFLSYLSEYIHLPFILKSLSSILIIKNFYTLTTTPTESIQSIQQDYYATSNFIILLNLFHSPILEAKFNFCLSLIPIILQASIEYKHHKRLDKAFEVFCLWGLGVFFEIIGWGTLWEWIKTMVSYFGIYFIEYPILFGGALFVGYLMEKVILSIENYTELIKTIGKSKTQLAVLYSKEMLQFVLLGFSVVFVRICEEIIDWYHGYPPVLVGFIANMAYMYPAVVLLSYPKNRANSRSTNNRNETVNYISILFSSYFIRYILSFIY